MSGSGKSEQEHVPHSSIKREHQEVFGRFRCSHAKKRPGNLQKSLLQLDQLLFFTVLVKGTQRPFSVKYLFGKANFA